MPYSFVNNIRQPGDKAGDEASMPIDDTLFAQLLRSFKELDENGFLPPTDRRMLRSSDNAIPFAVLQLPYRTSQAFEEVISREQRINHKR